MGQREDGEDGVMDSGSEGGYRKMGEQGSKGQGSTALPNRGMKHLFHCRNIVNKEPHQRNNCNNAILLNSDYEIKR